MGYPACNTAKCKQCCRRLARQPHGAGKQYHGQFLPWVLAAACRHVINKTEYRPKLAALALALARDVQQLCSARVTPGVKRVVKTRHALALRMQLSRPVDQHCF